MEILVNNEKFKVTVANTFFKRFLGLMGKRNITTGVIFPHTFSIHTFFMRENIDIIMLDKEKNIIFYQSNVPKNKIIIKRKAYYTIELPQNSIREKITKFSIV